MKNAIAFALIVSTVGCAGSRQLANYGAQRGSKTALRPSPGKAMLVFVRPASSGHRRPPSIWVDRSFVGSALPHSFLTAEIDPGEHLVILDHAKLDFVRTRVAAGKTYYVAVAARWKGFWLDPLHPSHGKWPNLDAWLSATRRAETNALGAEWSSRDPRRTEKMKRRGLAAWEQKGEPDIEPNDGI